MISTATMSNAQMRQARQSRDKRFDGLFFVGVLSTGIFCRPTCPAKMANEENVVYYENAIKAIDAGYRPCKLCKPDGAPNTKIGCVNDDIVELAITIMQRELDINIELLANRVNMSARRLNQRFHQCLGVSPSQYLRSLQLLFAKQLLQQSTLSILNVALASGFQSCRAMQYAFKKQFNMTPSSLRKTPTVDTLINTSLFLSYRPPYLWEPLRDFLALRSLPNIDKVSDNSYTRYFSIDGQPGSVIATHNEQKCGFELQICVQDPIHLKAVIGTMTRILDCDADWMVIEQAIEATGIEVNSEIKGLRIPGVWGTFEAGCRAILGQQVSVAAAISKTKQLVEAVRVVHSGVGFPEAQHVTAAIVNTIGMPKTRKQTLIDFAEYMSNVDHAAKVQTGYIDGLLALKGIGPWTCQYIIMRGTGHPDVWMEKDLAIIRQCEKYQLTPKAAKPWRSYLTLALWQDYFQQQ